MAYRAMSAPNSGLGESFLAAIQASLSVLLVMSYGGLAAKLKLLSPSNTRYMSKACVRIFLPALLFTNIGSELQVESVTRYAIVLVWAVFCHLLSFSLGLVAHLGLGMPDWTTVAIMFNNTASYPLLLIQALHQTGMLSSLVEDADAAVGRANSYFLVFSTVSNCITFGVGPRLIDSEHSPDQDDYDEPRSYDHENVSAGEMMSPAENHAEPGEHTRLLNQYNTTVASQSTKTYKTNSFFPSRRRVKASLNPEAAIDAVNEASTFLSRRASLIPRKFWSRLGPRARWWLLFISDFFHPALIGAILGAVVGLVQPLQRAFFSDTYDGGIFSAWLTASLKTVGNLFVPLPVVIAGVSLYTALAGSSGHAETSGQSSGMKLPRLTVGLVLFIRFILWPAISIPIVWALASKTSILDMDPMLWFAMMLMPCGPPAMKLIALVQVSDADESEQTVIAKILTV